MKYTIQTHDEATYNHSRIVSKNRNFELNWSIWIQKVKTADLVIHHVWGSIVDQSKTVYRNDITCLVMVFSYVANYSRNVFKSALNQSTLIFNLEMHSEPNVLTSYHDNRSDVENFVSGIKLWNCSHTFKSDQSIWRSDSNHITTIFRRLFCL